MAIRGLVWLSCIMKFNPEVRGSYHDLLPVVRFVRDLLFMLDYFWKFNQEVRGFYHAASSHSFRTRLVIMVDYFNKI